MQLKEFEYLTALAEEQSISKAANRLFMAQSSLSQFLSQYEADLGVKLFLRTSRGIKLTTNGEIYMERLKKLEADYQRARNELRDNENMLGGTISFGISSFRGNRTLPLILKEFHGKYPAVKVEIIEKNSVDLEEDLLKGTLDLAVIAMPASKLKHEVKFMTRDEICLVVPRYHPVMRRIHYKEDGSGCWIDLKDTVDYDFILSGYNTILGTIARNLFHERRLDYHALHDNITARMAVTMAMDGVGIAFTYTSCVDAGGSYELLSIGEEGVWLDIGTAYPTREYHSQAVRKLEEVIREVYAGLEK